MGLEFLNNLKNAVENGEFNSEAAKKIIEISNEANGVNVKAVEEKLKNVVLEPVSEEIAVLANTEYEIKMAKLKEEDMINGELALLAEIQFMVQLSIREMFEHIEVLIDTYIENKKELPIALQDAINEIKEKYESLDSKSISIK